MGGGLGFLVSKCLGVVCLWPSVCMCVSSRAVNIHKAMNYARKKAAILNHVIRPEEQQARKKKIAESLLSHANNVKMSVMYVFWCAGVWGRGGASGGGGSPLCFFHSIRTTQDTDGPPRCRQDYR